MKLYLFELKINTILIQYFKVLYSRTLKFASDFIHIVPIYIFI